ncbi:MAG: hypothetical protein CM15mP49_37050 [Actinomycetota bacterium]|nr:MAG: hypothetical protein CM15mP49_37050 [Actinomycetota bacterium]
MLRDAAKRIVEAKKTGEDILKMEGCRPYLPPRTARDAKSNLWNDEFT